MRTERTGCCRATLGIVLGLGSLLLWGCGGSGSKASDGAAGADLGTASLDTSALPGSSDALKATGPDGRDSAADMGNPVDGFDGSGGEAGIDAAESTADARGGTGGNAGAGVDAAPGTGGVGGSGGTDGSSNPGADAGADVAVDARAGVVGDAGGDAGADASGDGGVLAVLSNTPNAVFHNISTKGLGRQVVLSNVRLTFKPAASSARMEWVAEVVNQSNSILCFVRVTAFYRDASDSVMASPSGYADGPPYRLIESIESPSGCLAPGAHGAIWTISTGYDMVDLSTLAKVEYVVDPTEMPGAVPHAATPLLSDVAILPNSWAVKGVAKGVQAIWSINLTIYPFDVSDGLILPPINAINLENLGVDESWNWQSNSATAKFARYLLFPSFLVGTKH